MDHSFRHFVIIFLAISVQFFSPLVLGADIATGTMTISGTVPTVFSLTTRGLPGDLDLSPNVTVNDRLMGIVHFKYNVDIASVNMSSDTTSGTPENAGGDAYAFGTAFQFKFLTCTTVHATYKALFAISNVATAIEDPATTSSLTNGVEEDCELTASWGGDYS